MNKKQLIFALLFFFGVQIIVSNVLAGSNVACLRCKSGSGRTTFSADIWDISSGLESAEFSIDGKKVVWTKDDNAYVVLDPQNGIYTIYLEGETNPDALQDKHVEFWAIPSSFKILIDTMSHQKYKFKAKIYGTESRKDKDRFSPEIELFCTLDYEI